MLTSGGQAGKCRIMDQQGHNGNSDNISLYIYLSRLPQISDALTFVKEILQQLTNQRASIEEDIQSSFEDLHKQLDVRKSVLLMELEVTYGLKQKVLKMWPK